MKTTPKLYIFKTHCEIPFFDEYLKEIEELINPKRFISLDYLVNPEYHKDIYFVEDIDTKTGILAVKSFVEKFTSNYNGEYVGILSVDHKLFPYEDIDWYFSHVYEILERRLLNEYYNDFNLSGKSTYISLAFSIRKPGDYSKKTIVEFDIWGEPIDLF